MAEIPVLEAAPGQGVDVPKKRAWLIIAITAVVVLGGAGAGAWYLLSGDDKPTKPDAAAAHEEALKHPPLYIALDPPFVVNFEAAQLVRFLQVTVQVMTRDPLVVEMVKSNDPVVRNDLLLLLGGQKYESISSREGKEQLRQEALAVVRRVVKTAGGNPESVEAVYFTSFVMQ